MNLCSKVVISKIWLILQKQYWSNILNFELIKLQDSVSSAVLLSPVNIKKNIWMSTFFPNFFPKSNLPHRPTPKHLFFKKNTHRHSSTLRLWNRFNLIMISRVFLSFYYEKSNTSQFHFISSSILVWKLNEKVNNFPNQFLPIDSNLCWWGLTVKVRKECGTIDTKIVIRLTVQNEFLPL